MYCQGLCEGWKGQRDKIVVFKYSILPKKLGVGVDVLGGTTRQRGLSRSKSHRWPLGEQSHVWIGQHSVPPPSPHNGSRALSASAGRQMIRPSKDSKKGQGLGEAVHGP